ncbi:MAG: glycosyltransferase [Chloroflexota bacterium]|nr:glycosyltransferase [Chloroflexota bacterium]
MNIGVIHYKVGGTDGVSLEIEKWKQVLEELGHTVHLCGGDLGKAEGTLIEELYHHREDAQRLNYNTFKELRDYPTEAAYREELYSLADAIEEQLRAFIAEKEIGFLIPENVWCVAASPSVAIAVTRVMREYQLPALAHNHDFYWERTAGVALTCGAAIELAQKYLPPRDPLARHTVINSLGKRQLWERLGIKSTIVPNVFDFQGAGWEPDEYNSDFRARIGLQESDIFILQATRIVSRKGIELAVDFIKALDTPARRAILQERRLYDGRAFDEDSRIVLVLAGYTQDDQTGYTPRLKRKIEQAGIDALFIEDLVAGQRQTRAGEKIYSLWDTYVHADFVTYPSLWEGWGNQLLEALRAKLPILLYEYPVYLADIQESGLDVVSLGSEVTGYDEWGLAQVAPATIAAAADEAVELLTNGARYRQVVEHNFAVGQERYSPEALRGYLEPLVGKA